MKLVALATALSGLSRVARVPGARRRFHAGAVGAVAVASLAVASVACSATVEADQTGSAAQRLAVVDVRVQASSPTLGLGTADALKLEASARFVSVKEPGAPGGALDLLGLTYPIVPLGTCSLASSAPPAPQTGVGNGAVRVDLRDLSPVTLELRGDDGGAATLFGLEPKAFPDVAGLVSGVVFVAPSSSSTTALAPRFVTVHVPSATSAGLELPDLPARLQLVDAVSTEAGYAVDAGGLDVIVPASALPTDRLVVDVVRGGVVRAHCGADASGRLHIDGFALGGQGDVTLLVRAQRHLVRDDAALGAIDARLERAMDVKVIVR
ncbi:MAG: hypothetical protein ABI175_02295 [Polyangiales bacterium]